MMFVSISPPRGDRSITRPSTCVGGMQRSTESCSLYFSTRLSTACCKQTAYCSWRQLQPPPGTCIYSVLYIHVGVQTVGMACTADGCDAAYTCRHFASDLQTTLIFRRDQCCCPSTTTNTNNSQPTWGHRRIQDPRRQHACQVLIHQD